MIRVARLACATILGLLASLVPLLAPAEEAMKPLHVFAAASLTDAFGALEASWTGPKLAYNFAASSLLVVQIQEGAPADVIATADEPAMQRLVASKHVLMPQRFASNHLVIAVEPGNPKKIGTLADLARKDLIVVLAAPDVPAGRYAREMLAAAKVEVAPRSLEENVRAVLSKVALGEADAGIVYASDVLTSKGRVAAIEMPESAKVQVGYFIAPLRESKAPADAAAFVAKVLSPDGRLALEKAGFGPP